MCLFGGTSRLESLKSAFSFMRSWKSTYVSGRCPHFRAEDGRVEVRDLYSDYLLQNWLCANLSDEARLLLEGCIDGLRGSWDKEYLVRITGDKKSAVAAAPVDMSLKGYYKYA
ncbi:hypothetical protein MLD38_017628 [Melastoma candidum]|uniref:Uncharacterized protein n=1 Tax=Melastoma candidum TaxID=119954 RepID=A0ACB9QRA7_9MYRT|nr:hypothetical protein MLD38_017628 [Melastoma candidum]